MTMNDDHLKRIIRGMDDERLGYLVHLAVEEQIARGKRCGTKTKYTTCIACKRKRWIAGDDDICSPCKGYERKPAPCTRCGALCAPNNPDQTVCASCKKRTGATGKAPAGEIMPSASANMGPSTISGASTVTVLSTVSNTDVNGSANESATAGTAVGTTAVNIQPNAGDTSKPPTCKCGAKLSPTKRPDIVKLCYDCMKIDYFTRFPVVE